MKLNINHLVATACTYAVLSPVLAQTTLKPKIYVDPTGKHFTQAQFDSISQANMGKPIALKESKEIGDKIHVTFEILQQHPAQGIIDRLVGQPFPAFNLIDLKGVSYDNANMKGRVIVFNFWSTTCAPCIKEIPKLNELVEQYVSKDVVFLAPAPESAQPIERLLARHPFVYKILPGATSLFTSLGLDSFPFHIVVNQQGIIQAVITGSSVNTQTNEPILPPELVATLEKVLKP